MNNRIHFLIWLTLMAFKSINTNSQNINKPILSYSFEQGTPTDDSGQYPAVLMNDAFIHTTTDQNHILKLGNNNGYLKLNRQIGQAILSKLTDDYTISIDINFEEENNLNQYCWAWTFSNGTNQYMGLINTAGNHNWYYEIKNNVAERTNSETGLPANYWHNITVVCHEGEMQLYLNGQLKSRQASNIQPGSFAHLLTDNYLGKSPFANDAYMKNTLIDNFRIFDTALSATQVAEIANMKPQSSEIVLDENYFRQTNRKDLYLAEAARCIRKQLVLPTTCTYGKVEWVYTPSEEANGCLDFTDNIFTVLSRGSKTTLCGSLQGIVTYNGKVFNLYDKPLNVNVAADDNAYGYLYCHMPNLVPEPNPQTQCITFALGKEEHQGLVFNMLNRGSSIIQQIGTDYPWCRDAFMAKDSKRQCYYIVTTDLYGSENNGTSMLGNYSIGMFKSYDLINWSYSRCDIKDYLKENPVNNIYDNNGTNLFTWDKITRIWAPQIIFINGDPYIYYAAGNADNGNCDHFYISKANENFTGITSFSLLYGDNKLNNVLDADINFLETDSLYHMYYRDYALDGIFDITTADLLNPSWSDPVSKIKDEGGYEAPSAFRRINDDVWNIGYVVYAGNLGYHFYKADGMMRNLQRENSMTGNVSPQHGSFVMINETEYRILQTWSDLNALIEDGTHLNSKINSTALTSAIELAKEAINNDQKESTVLENRLAELDAAYTTLHARFRFEKAFYQAVLANLGNHETTIGVVDGYLNNGNLGKCITEASESAEKASAAVLEELADRLDDAVNNYYDILVSNGKKIWISNGTFNSNTNGWDIEGDIKINNGLAEAKALKSINYSLSISQMRSGLTTGYYLLKCQAFEQNGDNDGSGRNHIEGVEKKNFHLFANGTETEICSVYEIPYNGNNSQNGFVCNAQGAAQLFKEDSKNYCNYILLYVDNRRIEFGLKRDLTTVTSSDWCCFDNFELYHLDSVPTDVKTNFMSAEKTESPIYDLTGIYYGTTVNGELPQNLNKGIYCVNQHLIIK